MIYSSFDGFKQNFAIKILIYLKGSRDTTEHLENVLMIRCSSRHW